MRKQNKRDTFKIDPQYNRLSVFRDYKQNMVFYHRLVKKAYYIDQKDIRFIQLYFYRLPFVMLTLLLGYVVFDFIIAALLAILTYALFESWFNLLYLKSHIKVDNFKSIANSKYLQVIYELPNNVINIRIVAFFAISVVSGLSVFMSEYTEAYFIGMLGLSAFALIQSIIHIYVLIKKGKR